MQDPLHAATTAGTGRPGIAMLNALDTPSFTALLADVFEHSPWVAERAAPARPFADVADLHQAMCAVVGQASPDERLALLCAHPELAGKAALKGEITAASAREQAGAGLTSLSPADMAHIAALNEAYRTQHGFPFIVCVGRHSTQSLLAEFARRATTPTEQEQAEAFAQVALIARLRLDKLFPA